MADDGLIAMSCTIRHLDGALLAEASLLVFQPNNLEAYLQRTASVRENTSAL
ncbi:MAG: hypothetical protein LBE32_01800 [Burkholderiales bacterium]|nr:hypothetical protein [Burkholderiales bacterium]